MAGGVSDGFPIHISRNKSVGGNKSTEQHARDLNTIRGSRVLRAWPLSSSSISVVVGTCGQIDRIGN